MKTITAPDDMIKAVSSAGLSEFLIWKRKISAVNDSKMKFKDITGILKNI